MTTLAYCAASGRLAADTMAIHGNMVLGAKWKIGRIGPVLFGATGTSSAGCRRFIDWCRYGLAGMPPHAGDDHSGYMGFLFPGGDQIIQVCQNGINEVSAPRFAAGSGKKFALGAMYAGAPPRRAVEIALALDIYTNGDIVEIVR